MKAVFGVYLHADWNCSSPNPTIHKHPLTTPYHRTTSLASLPLAATLTVPLYFTELVCATGCDKPQGHVG